MRLQVAQESVGDTESSIGALTPVLRRQEVHPAYENPVRLSSTACLEDPAKPGVVPEKRRAKQK